MYDFLKMENGMLACPRCDSLNLHHERVEVFDRREDQTSGTHVTVNGMDALHCRGCNPNPATPGVMMDATMTDNPSSRRSGLIVGMWCEQCHERSLLLIHQHKGSTYLEWRRGELPIKKAKPTVIDEVSVPKQAQGFMGADADAPMLREDIKALFLAWQDRGVNEIAALMLLLNVSARGLRSAAEASEIPHDKDPLLESLLSQVRLQWNNQ